MFTETAKVQVKDGKTVKGEQTYSKVRFAPDSKDTAEAKAYFEGKAPTDLLKDAIAFLQAERPKQNGMVELLREAEYAYDLGKRNKIRQSILSGLEGPEKAIEKAIADLMKARQAMGKPISEEKARAMVMAED